MSSAGGGVVECRAPPPETQSQQEEETGWAGQSTGNGEFGLGGFKFGSGIESGIGSAGVREKVRKVVRREIGVLSWIIPEFRAGCSPLVSYCARRASIICCAGGGVQCLPSRNGAA